MSVFKLSYCEEETICLNKGNKIPIYAVYMKHTKKKKKVMCKCWNSKCK